MATFGATANMFSGCCASRESKDLVSADAPMLLVMEDGASLPQTPRVAKPEYDRTSQKEEFAETRLLALKNRIVARKAIAKAMTRCNLSEMQDAIDQGIGADLNEAELLPIKQAELKHAKKEYAFSAIAQAMSSCQLPEIRNAIDAGVAADLDETELQPIKDAEAKLVAKESALARIAKTILSGIRSEMQSAIDQGTAAWAGELRTETIKKEEAQQATTEAARDDIVKAMAGRDLEEMRNAIHKGTNAGLDEKELSSIKDATEVLDEHSRATNAADEALREEQESLTHASEKEFIAKQKLENQSWMAAYITGDAESEAALKESEEAKKKAAYKSVQRRNSTRELEAVAKKLEQLIPMSPSIASEALGA